MSARRLTQRSPFQHAYRALYLFLALGRQFVVDILLLGKMDCFDGPQGMEGSGNPSGTTSFVVLVHHPRSGFQTGAVASTSAASLHLGPSTPLELRRMVAGGASAGSEKCAAQLAVQRLEAALGAFGNESSPEKDAIEGFFDPCKGSSEGATRRGAFEVVRGVPRTVSEEVRRGPGRS